jgi:hypothetical protein
LTESSWKKVPMRVSKVIEVAVVTGVLVLVIQGLPDIKRFIEMRKM